MTNEQRTSPWVYVAVGCAVLLGIVLIAVLVVGYMGYRWTQELEAGFKDPEKRRERVLEILNAPSVPEGYHAAMALSIPFLMDMAVLSDRAPNEDGEIEGFQERGFVYLRLADMGDARVELQDFFEGRTDIPPLQDADLEVTDRTLIQRGEFPLENGSLTFAAYRGTVRFEESSVQGVVNFFMADCPGAERLRFGLWFGPAPGLAEEQAEAQAEAVDVSGTPADPEALKQFLSNFSICAPR